MTYLPREAAFLNIDNPLAVQSMAGIGDGVLQDEEFDFMEETPPTSTKGGGNVLQPEGIKDANAVQSPDAGIAIRPPMSVAVSSSHRRLQTGVGMPGPSSQAAAVLRMPAVGNGNSHAPCDPLGAVMEWLGHADLPEHLGADTGPPATAHAEGKVKGPQSSSTAGPGRTASRGATAAGQGGGPLQLRATSSTATKGRSPDALPGNSKASASAADASKAAAPATDNGIERGLPQAEGAVACFCVRGDKPQSTMTVSPMDEETEWDRRKRQTGVSARLVWYQPGDAPSDELVLRGGRGGRIVVTAVSDAGKAAAAGVRPGDVLASIDGKRDFGGHGAETILSSLVLPAALIFMGFIGKLQAEVRLNHNDGESLGMKVHEEVPIGPIGRPHAVKVVDKVVFAQPSDSSSMAFWEGDGSAQGSPTKQGSSARGLSNVVAMCEIGPDSNTRPVVVPQKQSGAFSPSATAATLSSQRSEDGLGPNLSVAPSTLPERLKPRADSFDNASWEEAFGPEDGVDTLLTV
eukprot:CAMPEP_0178463084 /NCGR_PEP_ID=MMETSP0689_2-20121128/50154_1 /TAXON_ID=160604 /ORGANISM="Amphidinium massartii, Strain CS-259" /LENGTH=518 /DNA_ID=CAMNT_0020089963 /DNA_START=9 /DNA_END=1566 /DNA_ORIENTATION=+